MQDRKAVNRCGGIAVVVKEGVVTIGRLAALKAADRWPVRNGKKVESVVWVCWVASTSCFELELGKPVLVEMQPSSPPRDD